MMRLRFVSVCVTFLVAHVVSARADAQTWTNLGPQGGPLRDMVVSGPSTIYVTGVSGGLFRTTQGGTSWRSLSAGLCDVHVAAVAIPAGNKIIYVGTDSAGVCRSSNGGSTWTSLKNTGLPIDSSGLLPTVKALTVDSTSTILNLAASTGLYRSIDSGTSWSAVPSITSAVSVVAAPSSPSIMYASAVDALGVNGIYRSSNGGSTWKEVNITLNKAGTISVDPTNTAIVYLSSDTVYKSTDSGTTWAAFNAGLNSVFGVNGVIFDPLDAQTVYTATIGCELCRSSHGSAWAAVPHTGLPIHNGAGTFNGKPVWVQAIAFDPASSQTMYAATLLGLYRSVDGGATWTAANAGLNTYPIQALALTGEAPAAALFATNHLPIPTATTPGTDVWRIPGGSAAVPSDPVAFNGTFMFGSLAADPHDPITYYGLNTQCGGVYRTADDGNSWLLTHGVAGNCGSFQNGTLVSDPVTSGTLFETGVVDVIGFARTTTGTAEWTPGAGLPNGPVNSAAVSRVHGNVLYATGNTQIFKSSDSGVTWITVSSGVLSDPDGSIGHIAIDPSDDNIVYIATTSGVLRSTDGGVTWTGGASGWPILNGKISPAAAIAVDPILPTTVYASSGTPPPQGCCTSFAPTSALGTGLYRSIDSGATWSLIPETAGYIVSDIRIDAHRAAFAATNNGLLRIDLTTSLTTDRASLTFNATTKNSSFFATPPTQTIQLTENGFGGVPWTASSSQPWLIVSPASGTGSGTLTLSVQFVAGLQAAQTATITITAPGAADAVAPITVTLNTVPAPPTVYSLDKTSLVFGATTNVPIPTGFVSVTPPQAIRLTQQGPGPAAWTATSSQPWLLVSPASGSSSAVLTIAVQFVGGLSSAQTGTITIATNGADNAVEPITVRLNTIAIDASDGPFGVFDTPVDGTTGVAGSIAVTGWALDDVAVTSVRIMREPVPGEGAGLILIGNAALIDGARPDVSAAFPATPRSTIGGWGYLLLTNFLPNQGNGTFTLHAIADDADGHSVDLGRKRITCTNSTAIKPFGAIDTPGQGEVVSGVVANFGWTLIRNTGGATPPRADNPGGGTVNVFVDGVSVGSPTGWTSRADLTALFPTGYSSLNSTLAIFGLDTTPLSNGVHTISWAVNATNGQSDGIGSRFFTVSNGALALAPSVFASSLRTSTDPMVGRRGFDLNAPYRSYFPGADGTIVVQAEELDRVELLVGATSGSLRTPQGPAPLPIGSRLDPGTGTFTWAPGVGFVGAYDFVFARNGSATNVRIVLNPKGSARVGPQIVIDAPVAGATLRGAFLLGGWAADLDAPSGTGISTVHVWAYPVGGGDPIFLGVADSGVRPDVGAIYGEQFRDSGYGLIVDGLPGGDYDLAVFGWSVEKRGFLPARVVRITVK